MSRVERAYGIINQHIGERYNRDFADSIIEQFGIEFGLDKTHKWSIFDDIEDTVHGVSIWTDKELEILEITINRGIISSFNLNETLLEEMVAVMHCPMCETGELEHRAIDNPDSMLEEKKTHMYVCDQCPAIMVEWYTESDTTAFAKGIR